MMTTRIEIMTRTTDRKLGIVSRLEGRLLISIPGTASLETLHHHTDIAVVWNLLWYFDEIPRLPFYDSRASLGGFFHRLLVSPV